MQDSIENLISYLDNEVSKVDICKYSTNSNIIAIDGPDGSGKSLFIDLIGRNLQIPILEPNLKSFNNISVAQQYVNAADAFSKRLASIQEPVLIQRSIIRNIVFAIARPDRSIEYLVPFIDILKKRGLVMEKLIFISASPEVCFERICNRGEFGFGDPKIKSEMKERIFIYESVIDILYKYFHIDILEVKNNKNILENINGSLWSNYEKQITSFCG